MRLRYCGKTCAASTFSPGWSIAHAAIAADHLPARLVGVALHVEEALDLAHHLLVGLFVLAGDAVADALLLHPDAHVLHVALEELGVLLLVDEAARRVELVLPRRRAGATQSDSRNSFTSW